MGFAFEGYTTAEFRGAAYSCAGGLSADVVAYLPTFLPNTPSLNTPYVLNALSNPGADCVVNLGECVLLKRSHRGARPNNPQSGGCYLSSRALCDVYICTVLAYAAI